MGLGGRPAQPVQPTTAPEVPVTTPADAATGNITVAGQDIPTKEWRDPSIGNVVRVKDVQIGDHVIGGVTGHSKKNMKEARDLVKDAVDHRLENMPYHHPDVVMY